MSDTPPVGDEAETGARTTLAANITTWIAVLAAAVSLGQAASSWITGYWQSQTEDLKAKNEIALEKVRTNSDLAKNYLDLFVSADVNDAQKILVLDALAHLPDHPLKTWAAERVNRYNAMNDTLLQVAKSRAEANKIKDEAERKRQELENKGKELLARIEVAHDNQSELEELRDQLIEVGLEQGRVMASVSIVTSQLDVVTPILTGEDTGAASSADTSGAVSSVASRLTPDVMKKLFASSAADRIDANTVFLQNALQEFQVSDVRMAACIVAVIAHEVPTFEAYEESEAAGQRYEGRVGLGNTEAGDGMRFRGRGYFGITGRTNYQKMSQRLGLADRLIQFPDDAKSPEIASRIAVAWIVDRKIRVTKALDEDNFVALRRIVVGGSSQVEQFKATYVKALALLKESDGNPT